MLSEGVAYARRRETGFLGLLWEEAILLLSETTVVQYTFANMCLLSPFHLGTASLGFPHTSLTLFFLAFSAFPPLLKHDLPTELRLTSSGQAPASALGLHCL